MLNYQASAVFDALGDPTRRAIVEQLSHGPRSVSQLRQPLDMTLAAVMQHLKVLEGCAVVTSEKVGRTRTCRLDERGLSVAQRWLAERQTLWQTRYDRLGAVLAGAPSTSATTTTTAEDPRETS